jgi:iron-sulfur cluster assembly protein
VDIAITAAAERFIKRMLRLGGDQGSGFRLVVAPGGCSGLSGSFSIELRPLAGDAVIERNGMRFFLPAETRLLLEGVTVDFADTPTETGLVFHDPKAVGGSCGSSGKTALPGLARIDVSRIGRGH